MFATSPLSRLNPDQSNRSESLCERNMIEIPQRLL